MLPEVTEKSPSSKMAVMVHDFLPAQGRAIKLHRLKGVLRDLAEKKQLAAIFITDIEIEKEDIYAGWSSFWTEFIKTMDETACGSIANHTNGTSTSK